MEGKAKVENGNRIDRVIRREEAAELLGIHVRTLTRMSLPSIKISQRAVGYRESVIVKRTSPAGRPCDEYHGI